MGWLWSSNSSTDTSNNASPTPDTTPKPSSISPPLSRDEIDEKELQSFLEELEADARPSSTKYNRVPKQPPPPSSSQSPSQPSSSIFSSEDVPLSEQLLPRQMSCRTAFDAAFYCNSLGGQFNNLYRYGNVRSCSENWNDFWFCMRTRTFSAPEKEAAIMARYREKERLRYQRGEREEFGTPKSSEDVWRSRERKLEWGKAFSEPYEEFDSNDGEWNKMERERRGRMVDGTS